MSRMSEDDLAEFLRQPHIGVLATLKAGGTPYTVPVWWLWHEGAFWLTGTTNRVWCRHLFARPRASLCVEATEPWVGHIGVDGPVTAHVPPEADIRPVSRLLVEKYVGRGDPANAGAVEAFLENMASEPRLLFRLAPEDRPNAIRAIDLRVYRGKRADREHQAANRAADL
jgi:PPOX class probable F420-dependent enzyme